MAWAITISFAGALISALVPAARPVLARWWALAVAVAGLAIAIVGFAEGVGQGRQVFVDDRPITFSAREIAVLEHLLRRSGRVVAKNLLENSLYGPTQEVGSNAVEVHVHRLRRHLVETGASVQVHTVRGVGYMIGEGG